MQFFLNKSTSNQCFYSIDFVFIAVIHNSNDNNFLEEINMMMIKSRRARIRPSRL